MTVEPLTADEYAAWLQGVLAGHKRDFTAADVTTNAVEYVNGELRPAVVAIYPGGGFVVTVAKIGPRDE